jgi:hypothetical protein
MVLRIILLCATSFSIGYLINRYKHRNDSTEEPLKTRIQVLEERKEDLINNLGRFCSTAMQTQFSRLVHQEVTFINQELEGLVGKKKVICTSCQKEFISSELTVCRLQPRSFAVSCNGNECIVPVILEYHTKLHFQELRYVLTKLNIKGLGKASIAPRSYV